MPALPDNSLSFHDQFSRHPQSVAERLRRRAMAAALRRIDDARSRDDEESRWLNLTPDSTEEQIEAALKADFPQPAPPRGTRWLWRADRGSDACPLTVDWKRWDIKVGSAHDFRQVRDEDRARCEKARGAMPVAHAGRVRLSWCLGSDAGEGRDALDHIHADTVVGGHVVHIDRLRRDRWGPGGSLTEFRIFVDGALAGRAGMCGCSLGGGGNELPAVARLGPSRAITVDVIYGIAFPVAELWQVQP